MWFSGKCQKKSKILGIHSNLEWLNESFMDCYKCNNLEFIPNAQHGAPRGPGNQMMRGFNPNRGGFNNRSGPRGQGPR